MRNVWYLVGLAAWASACGGSTSKEANSVSSVSKAEAPKHPCARAHSAAVPKPIGKVLAGSTVAIARQGKQAIAYVADEDTQSLYTVNADTLEELAATPLGGTPSQLLLAEDGRAIVALRDRDALVVLEPAGTPEQPLAERCTVQTPADPVAVAYTPQRDQLLVTSGFSHTLTGYGSSTFERSFSADLPRDPRAVVVSDDGARAFVSHAVGSQISIVNLRSKRRTPSALWVGTKGQLSPVSTNTSTRLQVNGQRLGAQGYALAKSQDSTGRILAPQVLVDRGNPERPTSGRYSEARLPQIPNIAVIDEDVSAALVSSLDENLDPASNLGWGEPQVDECLLPRAAITDPKGESLYVACMGIGRVVEYDALSADPRRAELSRWAVPAGPTGIALDPSKRRALVWSQFERRLSVIPLAERKNRDEALELRLKQVALSRPKGSAARGDVALGRKLFHAVGDLDISSDGRACASCHLEGRDDGLTWATPDGPRQTPILAGRLTGTAPFGWTGNGKKIGEHMQKTFARLGGKGLDEAKLGALLAYVASLEPRRGSAEARAALVARGKELFASPKVGCASCHTGRTFTDGERHDVASAAPGDKTQRFDTPSLLFLEASAPYFHDGRYATLDELLSATNGSMGHTAHLADDDREALVAYLRSL